MARLDTWGSTNRTDAASRGFPGRSPTGRATRCTPLPAVCNAVHFVAGYRFGASFRGRSIACSSRRTLINRLEEHAIERPRKDAPKR